MKNVLKTTVFLLLLSFLSLNNGNVLASDTLTLLLPSGGEVIPSGIVYTVQWEAPPDAVMFDLMYSMDEGMTWELIRDGVTNTSYDWYVPASTANGNICRVKVIGYNSSGERIGDDISDISSTIEGGN